MGLRSAVRFTTAFGLCLVTAISFNNCAPAFEVPTADQLSLLESASEAMCAGSAELKTRANQRLTSREYMNSLRDLFGGVLAGNTLNNILENVPRESLSISHSQLDFDSTLPRALQFVETEKYSKVAEDIGDQVAARLNSGQGTAHATTLMASACFISEGTAPSDSCLNKSFQELVFKIYRRPATADELSKLIAIQKDALNANKFEGVSFVLQYLLQTESFLYKVEGPFDGARQVYALNDYEIATRLAYGILSGPPPRWLLTAAGDGELMNAEKRAAVITKLFDLPAAQRATEDFYNQWLRTAQIPQVSDIAATELAIDPYALKMGAIQEIRDFTHHITWAEKGGYKELMTSTAVIPAQTDLAKIYGTPLSSTAVQGSADRSGLLSRVGMLMVKADGRSGPIIRGARIRADLLCDALPAPPDSVFSNLGTFNPLESTRKQTEDITRAPTCLSCHSQINHLGFAFENFSGLGKYRTFETLASGTSTATHQINAAGGSRIDTGLSTFGNGQDLASTLANSTRGPACMAKRYYQFVSGHAETSSLGCEYGSMARLLQQPGTSIVDMMKSYYSRAEILYRLPGAL